MNNWLVNIHRKDEAEIPTGFVGKVPGMVIILINFIKVHPINFHTNIREKGPIPIISKVLTIFNV